MTELKNTGFAGLIATIVMAAFLSYGATNVSSSAGAVNAVVQAPVFSVAEVMFSPDTTKPNPNVPLKIACPEDVSTYTDLNECVADLSYGLRIEVLEGTLASLTWQMSGATEDASPRNGINQLDNYVFSEGTTTVIYTARDNKGNTQTCTFNVIVSDNQVPKFITVPENITVNADENECGAHVTWDEPTYEDNCSSYAQILKQATHQSGAFFPIGTTRVTYTLDDGVAYNLNTHTFTVTVTDKVKPLLVAPQNIIVNCGDKLPPISANLQDFLNAGGTAYDNCALAATSFKFVGQSQNGSVCPYTVIRTYQIADNAGNITTTEQKIRVAGNEPQPEPVVEPKAQQPVTLKSAMADCTASNGLWNSVSTWSCGTVPTSADDVIIPAGVTVQIDGPSAACQNITINGTLNHSGATKLQVYGDWTNNGTYSGGTSGVIEFAGATNAEINGTTNFEDLIITKGSLSTTLTVNGTATVLSSGAFVLNSGLITIPTDGIFAVNPASALDIPAVGGFHVDGGTLNTGNFTISNRGLIRISDGTANFGTQSGNSVETLVDGVFEVSGTSVVNIAGRLKNSAGGTLSGIPSGINITGGTITLATKGYGLSNEAALSVTTLGAFNFTGGNIVIQNPNSTTGTVIDFEIAAPSGSGTKNITNGIFQFGNATTTPGTTFSISSGISIPNITSSANADLKLLSDFTISNLSLNAATTINLNGNALRLATSSLKTYTFPIDNGSSVSIPVTVDLTAGTFDAGAYIEIETFGADHPNNASTVNYLNRYWKVTTNGITNPVYNVTATYANADIPVGATESEIALGSWGGSLPWIKGPTVNSGANSLSVNGISATSYTFTGITLDAPTVSIDNGAAITICNGSTVNLNLTLTGDPVFTYLWSPAAGLSDTNIANPVASPTTNTTYTIVVTDGNGFTATENITITVDPVSVGGTIAGSATVCSGTNSSPLTLLGHVGNIVRWESTTDNWATTTQISNTTTTYTATNLTQTTQYRAVVQSGICAAANSATSTITVDPTSVGGTISPAATTVCSGTNSTTLTLSGYTGEIKNWQFSTDGGSTWNNIANTNAIYTATTLTQTTQYRAVVQSGVCPSAYSAKSTISVNPPSVGGSISGGMVVCFGTNSTTLNLSGYTGAIQKWEYSTDGGSTWIDIANTNPAYTATNLTQTTQYRAVVQNGVCAAAISETSTITVSPVSVGGSIAGGTTICAGSNSTTLTLSGHTGAVKRWQYSTDGGSTWIDITNTTTTYTALNLSQTTHFRAVVQSGVCDEVNSATSIITVYPVSVGGIISGGTTICAGINSILLTLSGHTGAVQKWQYSTNGGGSWSDIITTNSTYTATNLTQTTHYRAVVQSGVCPAANSAVSIIEVNPVSAGGAVSGGTTVCSGSNSTILNLSGQTGTVQKWQSSTDGGSNWIDFVNTNTTYTATNLTQTTQYRAVVQSGVCTEAYSNPAIITVNPLPVASISGTTAVCLNASNPAITITNPQSLPVTVTYNINGTGNSTVNVPASQSVTIPHPSSNAGVFTYNLVNVAYQSVPACSNTVTGSATVTVHANPTVNAIANQTYCNGIGMPSISLSGPVAGTTFTWTNSNTAIGLAASGNGNIPAFTTTNGTNGPITGTITVTPTANGCVGTPLSFTITVNPTATVSISGTTTVCQNDASPFVTFTNPLSLPVAVTYRRNSVVQPTINVAANSTATVAVPTNTAITYTFDLTSVEFQSTPTCSNGVSGTATVVVTPRANAVPSPTAQSICSTETANISLSSSTPGVTFNWTRNNTATVTGIADSGSGDISGTLTNTTVNPVIVTFTITAVINGCAGAPVIATVTVNPTPIASVSPSTQTRCSGKEAISSIVPTSTTGSASFTWTRDHVAEVTGIAASGTGTIPMVTLTNTTSSPVTVTFTFIPRANNCDGPPVTATVIVNPTSNIRNLTESICNSGSFNVSPVNGVDGVVPTGTNYNWAVQSSTGGITGATSGSGTSITGTLGNSTNTTQTVTYAVTPTFNGCIGELFLLAINVTPEPDINNMTATVCNGGSFTVTPVNGTNGIVPSGTSYTWSVQSNPGSVSGAVSGSGTSISGTLSHSSNTVQTVTYTVTPAGGTCSGDPFTLTVTVHPVADIDDLTTSVCSGDPFTMTPVHGSDGIVPSGTTYSWAAPVVTGGITGGTIGSGAASISGTLTNPTSTSQTATYTVTPSSGSCPGTPFTVTVTVNPKPSVNPMTATICSGGTFTVTPVDATNGTIPAGTTYTWTAPVVADVSGLVPGTDSPTISGTLVNNTSTVKTITYTVTPSADGCAGIPFSVIVTVNPAPSISPMSVTVCNGSAFSVTPVHGTNGTVPAGTTYSWTAPVVTGGLTGGAAGSGASISGLLTNPTNLVQTATYTVTTSSAGCAQTTFNLTVTVNPTPSVTIGSDASICYGATPPNITFTNLVNVPVTVTYKINGGADLTVNLSANEVKSIPATAANQQGDFVYSLQSVAYQSAPSCSATITGSATITVKPVTTAAITVSPVGAICSGTSVTFTATVANAGTNPTYKWYNKGIEIPNETGLTYTSSTLANADQISFVVTTYDTPCPGPTTSNTNTMTVNPLNVPQVSIYESANPICEGTPVTFTADPVINGGPSPAFQWYLNNNPVGGNSSTYTNPALVTGDKVKVVLTSSATCPGAPDESNEVTMTVNALLPASVSIAASANPVCAGTAVTFTATPINGGTTPAYQWKVNGTNVGTNSNTYSYTPVNGDVVTVVLTSNATCATGSPATSDPVTMTVNPNLPVSVSIAASANPVCADAAVTFTATPTNGGTTPIYQWKVNGSDVGTNTATFSSTTLNNGDIVTVVMTSSETCATGNPATSNAVTLTVNPILPASVSITASANSVCAGTAVTFTATPVNGGTTPTYQWYNGATPIAGATGATYTSSTLTDGALISVQMTSNAPCATGNPAASNVITMTISPNLPVSVSIAASANPVCAGTAVTFTATSTNGGTTPAYQWKVNGANVGTNSSTYSYTPVNNDVVTVVLTSEAPCATSNPATSNAITMTVNPNLPVSVSIAASANPVCAGTAVTFTATPVNGGATPAYQWQVNGSNVGTNSNIYTYTPANNDVVTVVLTSNATCVTGNPATSNSISLTVVPGVPAQPAQPTGPTSICKPVNGLIFTVTAIAGASSYTWTLPSGWTIASGSGTNSITVNIGSLATNGAQNITVSATNACGTSIQSPNLQVTVGLGAFVDAGPDQTICAGNTVSLSPTPGGATGNNNLTWSSSNGGTFSPNANKWDATYTPSAAAVAAGTVTLTVTTDVPAGSCPAVSDQIVVTIRPLPTASIAGTTTICSGSTTNITFTSTPNTTVTHTVSGVGGSSTINVGAGGTATLTTAALTANTTYTVTNVAYTTAPSCSQTVTGQTATITVNPAPTVNAGGPSTLCASATPSAITLTGASVGGGATTGAWSIIAGGGTLSSTAQTATPATVTYTPAANFSGTVTLRLTTNTPGTCAAATADRTITVTPAPTVNAGGPDNVCQSATPSAITLSGASVGGGGTTGAWSIIAGGGTLSSTAQTATPATVTYTPAANFNGTVTLRLTTNAPGTCSAATADRTITVTATPTVNAGSTITVCQSATPSAITLTGASVGGGATTGAWSIISGGGTLSNTAQTATPATVTYTPAANFSGTVTLRLTTNAPGTCAAVSADRTITVTAAPTVIAGGPDVACQSATPSAITLTGASVGGGATTGAWSIISGGGTLSSTAQTATPATVTYTPAANFSGTVTLRLTTDNSGGCAAVTADRTITISPAPTVDAGTYAPICSGTSVTLNGLISGGATAGTWTGGNGTFSDRNVLNPTYTPSGAEIAAGSVTLTLTTTDHPATCGAVSATTTITINRAVVITAQPLNTGVCEGEAADLNVTATGMGLTYQWYKGATAITGATTPTLHFNAVSFADAGTYYVVVSGTSPCQPVTSNTVTLNVDAAITISTQPASLTLCEGENVSFNVVASANGAPLAYQWRKDGIAISGATSSSYMITGITLVNAGSYDVVISSSAGFSCSSVTSATAVLSIGANGTIDAGSSTTSPTLCMNTPLTNINFTIGGSADDAVLTGALPDGLTHGFIGGVYTISGTPTETGTFNYTVTTTGSPCTNPSLSGTITVNAGGTISLGGGISTQTVCINNPLTNISYLIGGTATGAEITSGSLPAGVSGSYSSTTGLFTISGIPTAAGAYPFTVTTTGSPCDNLSLSGTITVTEDATIVLTTGNNNQSMCIGNGVTPISYTIGGSATGVNLSGSLPSGVSGTLIGNVYTISGTPTETGTFNYTLTTTGPCLNNSLSGVIQVNDLPDGGFVSPAVSTACTTTNSGTLTLESYNGNIIQWESSADGGITWTIHPVTTNSFTYTNLPGTTLFTALVGNANCPQVYSGVARVTVIPEFTPVITTTGGDICAGEPVTLTGTVTVLPDTLGAITGGLFDQANPKGWQVYQNGIPLFPFPASNDNEKKGPWAETNGPKTFCGSLYDSGQKKFSVVHGDAINSWMETPVFSLVNMSSAALTFDHAYKIATDATAKVMLSTDGGATYSIELASYSGTLNSGMPNVVNDIALDMSPYLGLNNLRIRFEFDSPTTCSVWAIDNIMIPSPPPDVTYAWGPIEYIPGGSGQSVVVLPLTTTTYTLTMYIAGCPGSATEEIVYIINNPEVTTTNACVGGSPVTFVQTNAPDGGTWSVTGGGTINATTGVFTPTEPGCFEATYTTASGGCSGSASFVVFPAAPTPVVNEGCGPIIVTPPPAVYGFDVEYSFDGGATWGGNTPPTDDNCSGYHIKTRYILVNACDIIPGGEISSDPVCSESPAVIRIIDSSAPTFTVPADITISKDASCNYDASVGVTGDVSDELDNCATGLDATYTDVVFPGACDGEIIIERTWMLEDGCGNQTVKIQTITVADNNTGPAFTVPADITINKDANCNYDASVSKTGDVTDEYDNCSTASEAVFTDVINTGVGLCADIIITRTWTLTDNCGNTTTKVQTITVEDITSPVITCPPATEGTVSTNECYSVDVVLGTPTVTDNCTPLNQIVITNDAPAQFPLGNTTVTWTATDACGNTATCTQLVTVTDNNQPPVITCPDPVVQNAEPNSCFLNNVAIPDPVYYDNCAVTIITWSYTDPDGDLHTSANTGLNFVGGQTFETGVTTVVYTAYDAAGNSATCSFTVTIKDVTPPYLSVGCADVTETAGPDDCFVIPFEIYDPVVGDICWPDGPFDITWAMTGATIRDGVGSVKGQTFNVGVTYVTYTVKDPDNNVGTCSFKVTVIDLDPPQFSSGCPADVGPVPADPGLCTAAINIPVPLVNDPCSQGYTLVNDSPYRKSDTDASGDYPVGVTTIHWTITDASGNATTCTQTVEVFDDQQPTITCPVSSNPTDPDLFEDFVSGDGCTWTPTFVPNPTYDDNCAVVAITYTLSGATTGSSPATGFNYVSDVTLNLGITTVTYTAWDAAGNSSEPCSIRVWIKNIDLPRFNVTCPAVTDISEPADPGVCETQVTIQPPAIDNFCVEVFSVTYQIDANPPVSVPVLSDGTISPVTLTFAVRTYNFTWIVTDASGTPHPCNITITVEDTQNPKFTTCPPNVEDQITNGGCDLVPTNVGRPVVTDNCTIESLTYTLTGATTATSPTTGMNYADGLTYNVGITLVTYTATDIHGNTSTCSHTVWIKNLSTPKLTVTCPVNLNVPAALNRCDTLLTVPVPVINNPCNEKYRVTNDWPAAIDSMNVNGRYPVGTTTITWTITDASGNVTTCTQTITVNDTQNPIFTTCPPNVEDQITNGGCDIVPTNVGKPVVTDNCAIESLTYTLSGATTATSPATGMNYADGLTYNVGITLVTYTATDIHGNTSTCSHTVWIKNLSAPKLTVTCPVNLNVPAALNRCDTLLSVPVPVINNPCNEKFRVTNDWPAAIDSMNVNGRYPVGTTTITWTITDASGNVTTCTQTITVNDTQNPIFTTCPPNVEDQITNGGCDLVPTNVGKPVVTDNCAIESLTYTLSGATTATSPATGMNYADGLTYNVGITLVTYTATDIHGNTSTCSHTVWIKNLNAPKLTVTCPTDIIQNADPGECYGTVNVPVPVINNPCNEKFRVTNDWPDAIDSMNVNGRYPIGTTTITWTITDASGNIIICTQDITINDLLPTLICPPPVTVQADFELPYKDVVTIGLPAFDDNCPDSTLVWTMVEPDGTTTTGDADPSGINLVPNPRRYYVGTTTITYTFTDAHNHSVSCSFTVTVLGKPVIDCPDDYTTTTDPGVCTATRNSGTVADADHYGLPTLIEGIQPITWEWAITNPDGSDGPAGTFVGSTTNPGPPVIPDYAFWLGSSTITWIATNVSGADTCSHLVIVEDKEPPTFDAGPFEFCVDPLNSVVYDGNADQLIYNPDYPDADYYTFEIGSTVLDVNIATTYDDNCCVPADGYSIRWRIDFDGTEPSISGTGQPSTYIDPVLLIPVNILLWGDGVNFQNRVHTITYWITDCHGNESDPLPVDITITPRPEIIKQN